VYPAAPTRNIIFNAQRSAAAGIATGVALANMSGQTATVTIRLHNDSGEEVSRIETVTCRGRANIAIRPPAFCRFRKR
jgi:hypothetical protein